MNQIELELKTFNEGKERQLKRIARNEEQGSAFNNPYAASLYRRFVLPLANTIDADIATPTGGRRKAHVALLKTVDSRSIAYLAVRHVIAGLLTAQREISGRELMRRIGTAVYHEYMLKHFEHIDPALFHTLVYDFERRHSKSERHRMTVFKMQAKQAGIEWQEWGIGNKEQVGGYLLDQLAAFGMLEVENMRVGPTKYDLVVTLTPETIALVEEIKEFVAETTPYFLPCIEPPKDWVGISDGGWHTPEMRRLMPHMVQARDLGPFREADLSTEMAAVNRLQQTRWRINKRVLEAVKDVARRFDMDEILSQAELPKPAKPAWLEQGMNKEDMLPEQLGEFVAWKRAMAEWHTTNKLRGTKYGRFYTAMRVAEQFKDYDALHFVYFCDFRGRKYVQTTGVSPQGSDLQKSLLTFADALPLTDDAQRLWFKVHGANRFGFDKAPLAERAAWVDERRELICNIAYDPISYRDWMEADMPLQFLAWCFEYKDFVEMGSAFRSSLPVAMDGTCNGLQNFSALLLDEIGGRATNLVPSEKSNDIYMMVAERTAIALQAAEEDSENLRSRWLKHGITRSLVKRSVMTLPYGSTRFSCAEFIVQDYLRAGTVPEFTKAEYKDAATYLSFFVWEAIGDVVVKAREAMTWLQKSAQSIIKSGEEDIRWITPSGFPVIQVYQDQDFQMITTHLCGGIRIRCYSDTESPDVRHHKNGIAPNFVHSLDASHLSLTTLDAYSQGVHNLAMIHDDYGCHAAHAPTLYRSIREVFVRMYSGIDPLESFANRYADKCKLPAMPKKGNLNLEDVLESQYFFS